MRRIQKTALLPYSAQRMFDLVNDIPAYPQFLPWCKSATILSRDQDSLVATIVMGSAGLEKSFTTKNSLQPYRLIEMQLVEGPFSHLRGCWQFLELGEEGCKISLDMEFEISNKLLRVSLEPVFMKITHSLIDAFVRRANKLYGQS